MAVGEGVGQDGALDRKPVIQLTIFMDFTNDVLVGLHRQVKAEGKPTPPWFGTLGKYTRHAEKHDMESIRQSIAAGLAKDLGH